MDAVARAIVLASQSFTAGIPFVIVVSSLAPHDRDVASRLIARFHLQGATADQVRTLFLAHNDAQGAVTWISVVFLVASAMSFAAVLQVVYERALSFHHVGLRARWRPAVWLLGASLYIGSFVELKPNIAVAGSNLPRTVISILASFIFWFWTPRIQLGPRVPWRSLVPIAGLTTVSVTILAFVSPLYMPQMIRDDAARYGTIGAVFALLSWLVVLAFLIVGSAVVASQIDRDRTIGPSINT
jgi:uncharacterized BrkB/YihY/UPF0761 family membrane protein